MGFATEASTECKMGGTHSSPAALGLGRSAPTHPKFTSFCFGLGGGKRVFYPPRPDYKRFNIYKPGSHSQPCLCPHGLLFFQQSCYKWVICYINNLSLLCITVCSCNIIFCVNFFRALTASSGGAHAPRPPPPPLLGPTLK